MRAFPPTRASTLALAWAALGLSLGISPRPAPAAYLVVPLYDAAGATDRLFTLELETGAVDELVPRRGGLVLEARRLGQNLFADIGRRPDNPAAHGGRVAARRPQAGSGAGHRPRLAGRPRRSARRAVNGRP